MSLTTDNPGATRLFSSLLPSVMLLASSSVTGTGHHWTGAKCLLSSLLSSVRLGEMDSDNTEMDREKIDSWKKSSDGIDILHSVGHKDWLGTDISNLLTTSEQSSENENEKNAAAFFCYSVLICFLLFPSLLENKKYEARLDYHESCHLQTSAISKVFPDAMQTFEVTIVFEKNQIITVIFTRFDSQQYYPK